MATINHKKYDEATETFKDFNVYDGKETLIFKVDGEAGNVGIGTTSLEAALDIRKDSGVYELVRIQNASAGALYRAVGYGGGSVDFGADDTAASTAIFRTAGSERMRIASAGNVGIGTSSPSARLSIQGSGSYNSTGWGPTATMNIRSNELTNNDWNSVLNIATIRQSLIAGSASYGGIGFTTIDDSNNNGISDAARIALVNENPASVYSPTAFAFYTNAGGSDGASTEKMRITSTGAVGIGTNSPTVKLQVVGDVSATDGVLNTNANSRNVNLHPNADFGNGQNPTIQVTTNHSLQIATNNTIRASFTANGLCFGSDTAAANALDDYEEGTWTGTLKGDTTDPTTPVTATGRYTKIGRMVTAEIQIDSANTTGASGGVFVTGLPFTSLTEAQGAVMCDLYNFGALCTSVNCYVSPFGTKINFFTSGSGVAWSPLSHNAGTNRSLRATLTYFV